MLPAISSRRCSRIAWRLLAGEAAVIVGVEPGEELVSPLDHLRAGDVGIESGRPGAAPCAAATLAASNAAPGRNVRWIIGNPSLPWDNAIRRFPFGLSPNFVRQTGKLSLFVAVLCGEMPPRATRVTVSSLRAG